MFEIKMGIPQMENLWNELVANANSPKPNKAQLLLFLDNQKTISCEIYFLIIPLCI